MRYSVFVAAVLALVFLASGGGGTEARPVVSAGGSGATGDRAVAVELTGTGTDSSAQPSNCTYGNNTGGQCPPTPSAGR
ncbi:hypothetical protein ACP70R_025624 [Stipagrostis hirtigluma subsp. patula]